jgi:hypothetical protein
MISVARKCIGLRNLSCSVCSCWWSVEWEEWEVKSELLLRKGKLNESSGTFHYEMHRVESGYVT